MKKILSLIFIMNLILFNIIKSSEISKTQNINKYPKIDNKEINKLIIEIKKIFFEVLSLKEQELFITYLKLENELFKFSIKTENYKYFEEDPEMINYANKIGFNVCLKILKRNEKVSSLMFTYIFSTLDLCGLVRWSSAKYDKKLEKIRYEKYLMINDLILKELLKTKKDSR